MHGASMKLIPWNILEADIMANFSELRTVVQTDYINGNILLDKE